MKTEKNYSSLAKDNSQCTHPLTPSPHKGCGKISLVDMKNRKVAFTLAEVLITLGIIGVVAALTIPNLVANHKKHVVESKLQKAYTTIYNAFVLSEAENGNLKDIALDVWNRDTYWGSAEFFDNYILPYLKIVKDVGKARITVNARSGSEDWMRTVILPDGITLTFSLELHVWPWNSKAEYKIGNVDIFLDDRYDKKKQLKPGKNYFRFIPAYANQGNGSFKITNLDFNGVVECGSEELRDACIQESEGKAADRHCTRMIMCNGWKIPDDYPGL